MKTLLTVVMLLLASNAQAEVDCKIHQLFCKIVKLKPKVDREWAMQLSNKLSKKAKENGLDPNISLAIMMQESSLENVNTFTKDEHIEKKCTQNNCVKTVTQVNQVVDMSIAQINIKTAVHYQCDIEKLFFFDEEEALNCHFKVLKDKLRLCSGQDKAWACYHSINEPYRSTYIQLVERFM